MNRRNTLLIYCIFVLISSTSAQSFKGGLHVGLLASQVDGDNMDGYHKPGAFAGAFVNLPLKDGKWQLQMELDYMQKGCKATNQISEDVMNDYHLTFHQIGLPVLLQWNTNRYLLEAGCSFNITPLIRERRNGELWENGSDGDIYRFFEFSGICGAGMRFNAHWDMQLRFLYSLLPVGKSFYKRFGLRNNSLLLSASYTF